MNTTMSIGSLETTPALDADIDIEDITRRINRAHKRASTAARTAIARAIEAGELLIQAKNHVPHGSWQIWLQANFKGSSRTAQTYMRVAEKQELIKSKAQSAAHLTLGGALKIVSARKRQEQRPASHTAGLPAWESNGRDAANGDGRPRDDSDREADPGVPHADLNEESDRRSRACIHEDESPEQVADDHVVGEKEIRNIVSPQQSQSEVRDPQAQQDAAAEMDCGVQRGDFGDAEVGPESVDMIFTDPSHDEHRKSIYADLAEFAARVLRPSGWVLAYCSQEDLPEAMRALAQADGLQYARMFSCHRPRSSLWSRKCRISAGWLPVIAAYRPPLKVFWEEFVDLVSGGGDEDSDWSQCAEREAAYFIQRLCPEGGLVCDPMAGTGTTLVAAKTLGCELLGFGRTKTDARKAQTLLLEAD